MFGKHFRILCKCENGSECGIDMDCPALTLTLFFGLYKKFEVFKRIHPFFINIDSSVTFQFIVQIGFIVSPKIILHSYA